MKLRDLLFESVIDVEDFYKTVLETYSDKERRAIIQAILDNMPRNEIDDYREHLRLDDEDGQINAIIDGIHALAPPTDLPSTFKHIIRRGVDSAELIKKLQALWIVEDYIKKPNWKILSQRSLLDKDLEDYFDYELFK